MTTAFTLNAFPPAINVSVTLDALSVEQKRDLIFELLRSTGIAFVPELKQSIEAISEALNFYVAPTKVPVPKVDPFLRLTREEKRTIVVGLLDASTRKDDKYIRLSARLNKELPGNRDVLDMTPQPLGPSLTDGGPGDNRVERGVNPAHCVGKKVVLRRASGTEYRGTLGRETSNNDSRYIVVGKHGIAFVGGDPIELA